MSLLAKIFLVYLFINTIMSIVSKSLIDKSDEYWKRFQPSPSSTLSTLIMFPMLLAATHISFIIGIFQGVCYVIARKSSLEIAALKHKKAVWFRPIVSILVAVVSAIIYLPLFVIGTIVELRFRLQRRRDNKGKS